MSTRLFAAFTLLVVGAAVLSGCGSSSSGGSGNTGNQAAAPAQPATDPCSLISKEAVGQIINKPVLKTERKDENGVSNCFYYTQEDGLGTSVMVGYWLRPYTLDQFQTDMCMTLEHGSPVPAEKVSGIGEAAFYDPGLQVIFLRKNRAYGVLPSVKEADTRRTAFAIAQAVDDKLK